MVDIANASSCWVFLLLFSHSVMSDSLQHHGLQHARLPCPSPSLEVCSDSCPLSWWCHPAISSSVICFSSCLQSFPASRSFPIRQLFASDGPSIGASASASVLPMNFQGWFPLGLTCLISFQSKGLSRAPQFNSISSLLLSLFTVQLSHLYVTTEKKHSFDYTDLCLPSDVSAF